jgi:hypothetical protein
MNMIKVHGRGVVLEDIGKEEGWHIEQIEHAFFARNIVFESDEAQLMFHLKYGYGK